MPNWKDKEKRLSSDEIESSEIHLGRFRLIVHRHINYPANMWLASCTDLFSQIKMASKDLDEAKCQAKAKVRVILEDALKDVLEA